MIAYVGWWWHILRKSLKWQFKSLYISSNTLLQNTLTEYLFVFEEKLNLILTPNLQTVFYETQLFKTMPLCLSQIQHVSLKTNTEGLAMKSNV